jgi:hypothetical protein
MKQIKAWLLWAVTQAEAELGSGTGKLKLSMVYGAFVEKFTWLAKLIPLSTFSGLVDSVLGEMHRLVSSNAAVEEIVKKPI